MLNRRGLIRRKTMILGLAIAFVLLVVPLSILRLLSILLPPRPAPLRKLQKPNRPVHLLVVLGSGGHTAEMLALLRNLDPLKYPHRTYVVSSNDSFSASKAREFEARLAERSSKSGIYTVATVPRARKIHQSLLTTPFSSCQCLLSCTRLLSARGYPDLIMCNGPATAVILILASLILRFFGACRSGPQMRTVYVESWARVKKLSLSGRLLLPVVDRFIVQWQVLADSIGGRAEYIGVLV